VKKGDCWASACGDIFKNPHTDGYSGQQNFTGLTKQGNRQHNKHLADVKEARKDPIKRQFEKNFLKWFQGQRGIQCSTYEDNCKRQNKKDPKDGIATDSQKDEEWDDSCLCPDELAEQSEDEEQKFGLFAHSVCGFALPLCNPMCRCCHCLNMCFMLRNNTSDNGAISPVIQTTNGSRVPSSRPRTDVRPRGKDAMSNAEHKVEWKR